MERVKVVLGVKGRRYWTRPPSEVVAEGLRLEAELESLYRETAAQNHPGVAAVQRRRLGERSTRVATQLGVNATHYRLAKLIVRAAQNDPRRYGDLVDLMDHAGIRPAHRLYVQRRDSGIFPVDAAAVERLTVRIDDLTNELGGALSAGGHAPADLAEQIAKQIAITVSKLRKLRNQLNKERG